MKFLTLFLVFAALISTALISAALAANAIQGVVECPVIGATGVGLDWDYDRLGDKGPADWHNSHPDCAGQKQSPVNFPSPKKATMKPKSLGPKPSLRSVKMSATSTNNNFALACPVAGTCGYTRMDGVNYTVANAHYHSPSEHTLHGKRYPLELHVVHANPSATKFLVLAVMFDQPSGDDYPAGVHDAAKRDFGTDAMLKEALTHVKGGGRGPAEFRVPLASVVQGDKGFCSYDGSLTTPPCTEAVTFYMSLHVMSVTEAQVYNYKVAAGAGVYGNNRPLQPINGREVTCYVQ